MDHKQIIAARLAALDILLTEEEINQLTAAYASLLKWETVVQGMLQAETEPALIFQAKVGLAMASNAEQFAYMSLSDVATLIAKKELSPVEVTQATLARISALDGKLHAYYTVFADTALALPCGFSASGLPLGFQIAGKPFDEATVFQVGHAYEQFTPWHHRHPMV